MNIGQKWRDFIITVVPTSLLGLTHSSASLSHQFYIWHCGAQMIPFIFEEKSRDSYHHTEMKKCLFPNRAGCKIAERLQSRYGNHNREFTRNNPGNVICNNKRGKMSCSKYSLLNSCVWLFQIQLCLHSMAWNGSLVESKCVSKQTHKMHRGLPFWQVLG